MNAVSASHDTHLLKIDNKVDKKNAVVFDLAVFLFGFVVVSFVVVSFVVVSFSQGFTSIYA